MKTHSVAWLVAPHSREGADMVQLLTQEGCEVEWLVNARPGRLIPDLVVILDEPGPRWEALREVLRSSTAAIALYVAEDREEAERQLPALTATVSRRVIHELVKISLGHVQAARVELTEAAAHASDRITVTDTDLIRLKRLLDDKDRDRHLPSVDQLASELESARVVRPAQISRNVVTMNSSVIVEDVQTRRRQEVSLVYPPEANGEPRRLSIFTPIGVALLGRAVGEQLSWVTGDGRKGAMRLVAIPYQPEAAGHFHL